MILLKITILVFQAVSKTITFTETVFLFHFLFLSSCFFFFFAMVLYYGINQRIYENLWSKQKSSFCLFVWFITLIIYQGGCLLVKWENSLTLLIWATLHLIKPLNANTTVDHSGWGLAFFLFFYLQIFQITHGLQLYIMVINTALWFK